MDAFTLTYGIWLGEGFEEEWIFCCVLLLSVATKHITEYSLLSFLGEIDNHHILNLSMQQTLY